MPPFGTIEADVSAPILIGDILYIPRSVASIVTPAPEAPTTPVAPIVSPVSPPVVQPVPQLPPAPPGGRVAAPVIPPLVTPTFDRAPGELREALSMYWPSNLWEPAAKITFCESSWRLQPPPNITPDEESYGPWQINLLAHDVTIEQAEDWFFATQYAYKLYLDSGWQPWINCAMRTGVVIGTGGRPLGERNPLVDIVPPMPTGEEVAGAREELQRIFQQITNDITGLQQEGTEKLQPILHGIQANTSQVVGDAALSLANAIHDSNSLLGDVGTTIRGTTNDIVTGIANTFRDFRDQVATTLTTIIADTESLGANIKHSVQTGFDVIAKNLSELITSTEQIVLRTVSEVNRTFELIKSEVSTEIEALVQQGKDVISFWEKQFLPVLVELIDGFARRFWDELLTTKLTISPLST